MLMPMPKLVQLSLLLLPILAFTSSSATKVEATLKNKIANASAGATWQVFVLFKSDKALYSAKPNPTEESHISHYKKMLTLEKYSGETQAKVMSRIKNFFAARTSGPTDMEIKSYWNINGIFIDKASKDLLDLLGDDVDPENENITTIVENSVWPLGEGDTRVKGELTGKTPSNEQLRKEAWGIDDINARAWWDKNWNGTGVIVGHIDSGVDIHHSSLRENWMGIEEGWHDPIDNTTKYPFENDLQDSHGTHTLGSLAGRGIGKPGENSVEFFGVGVAPGARWMSCRACRYNVRFKRLLCETRYIVDCMEFLHCPTRDNNCFYKPDVVSVSMGCPQNGTFPCPDNVTFESQLAAWVSDGIIPVFAAGNQGEYGCVSVSDFGERVEGISVGNIDKNGKLNRTSSMGPPTHKYSEPDIMLLNITKPDLVAPGTNIYSTVYAGEKSKFVYDYQTGSSMAAPHVAGAIALLLSRNRELTFDQVKAILLNRTDTTGLSYEVTTPTCGKVADDIFPNFKFGYGRMRLPPPDDKILPAIPNPPTRKMPPPPDYGGLDSAPSPLPARMIPMIMIMVVIAYLMN